jgi:hypothetical protein
LVLVFAVCLPVWALNSDSVARLKQAGLSDETLVMIEREKVIQTGAFSVQDIIDLKAAGVAEPTIQTLITERSHVRSRAPKVYGKELQSVRALTVKDVVALRDAGISDAVIQEMVSGASSTAHHNDAERERAWRMLEKMGVIVDARD